MVQDGPDVSKEVIDLNNYDLPNFDLVASAEEIENNIFEIKVLQIEKQDVSIIMKDESGQVLYSSLIENQTSFIQKFELTQKFGKISLEISNKENTKNIVL